MIGSCDNHIVISRISLEGFCRRGVAFQRAPTTDGCSKGVQHSRKGSRGAADRMGASGEFGADRDLRAAALHPVGNYARSARFCHPNLRINHYESTRGLQFGEELWRHSQSNPSGAIDHCVDPRISNASCEGANPYSHLPDILGYRAARDS